MSHELLNHSSAESQVFTSTKFYAALRGGAIDKGLVSDEGVFIQPVFMHVLSPLLKGYVRIAAISGDTVTLACPTTSGIQHRVFALDDDMWDSALISPATLEQFLGQ